MSHAAKTGAFGGARLPQPADDADGDIVHFLTRTLQAHFIDGEPQRMLLKLQHLKSALDQQEITLADWPDSPSKGRIREALAKARNLVAEIAENFGSEASGAGNNEATRKTM
jgi:hypothetical protein